MNHGYYWFPGWREAALKMYQGLFSFFRSNPQYTGGVQKVWKMTYHMTMQCTHATNITQVSVEHKALCSLLLCTTLKAISHISQSELLKFSTSLSISFNSSRHSKCIFFLLSFHILQYQVRLELWKKKKDAITMSTCNPVEVEQEFISCIIMMNLYWPHTNLTFKLEYASTSRWTCSIL